MKKLASFLLSLLIVLGGTAAGAEDGFGEYFPPAVTPSDIEIELPDSAWEYFDMKKPEDVQAEIERMLLSSGLQIVSLSPTGASGIADFGGGLWTYYEGKYRPVYPSQDKGVEDIHTNMYSYLHLSEAAFKVGREGYAYSPDGRYAVRLYSTFLSNSNFKLDPILIDLMTGEAVLTATYGNSLRKDEDFGTLVSACFSPDSSRLFYLVYRSGGQYSVMCYDIAAQSTKTLMTTPYGLFGTVWGADMYYPRLCCVSDSTLLVLNSAPTSSACQGITEIRREYGEVYSVTNHLFPIAYRIAGTKLLSYSPASGKALLSFYCSNGGSALMCIDVRNGFSGMDAYWTIDKDSLTLHRASPDELLETVVATTEHVNSFSDGSVPEHKMALILKAELSPDGRCALVRANVGNEKKLLLLDLEDMSLKVFTDDFIAQMPLNEDEAFYKPMFEWTGDVLVFQLTDEQGQVVMKTYTLR